MNCATPQTAVQIVRGALNLNFDVGHTAQAVQDSRFLNRPHGSITNNTHVGHEQIKVFFDKRNQVRRSDLLFAFDEELNVDRGVSGRFQIGLQRFDVDEQLPLVISSTTGIDLAVFLYRFKRRRLPAIGHLGRNDVVVTIHQDSGLVWPGTQPFAIGNGITSGFHHLDIFQV